MKGCSFFGLHTILFVLGGVVVDFRASSFGLHIDLFFFGGVGKAFGIFSFVICLTFFCSGVFFDFFVLFHRPVHHLRLDIDLP